MHAGVSPDKITRALSELSNTRRKQANKRTIAGYKNIFWTVQQVQSENIDKKTQTKFLHIEKYRLYF